MAKKSSGWNLQEMQDTLVKDTEQKITDGFEQIANGGAETFDEDKGGSDHEVKAATFTEDKAENVTKSHDPVVTSKARAFHKERKQDVLVHCPVSLHRKLKELKDLRWDEDGIRVNINDMVVDAIADWLDKQDGLTIKNRSYE